MDLFVTGSLLVVTFSLALAAIAHRCITSDPGWLQNTGLIASTVLIVGSLAVMPGALWLAAMACDEWCSDEPHDWTSDRFAWQYPASGLIALLAAGTAVAALVCLARRSYPRARALAIFSPILWLIWAWGFANTA